MGTKEEVIISVDVKQCARCFTDHEVLKFTSFINPISDSDDTIWNYWALCPTTGEPILLRTKEIPDGEGN